MSESFRERLRRLRREPAQSPPEVGPESSRAAPTATSDARALDPDAAAPARCGDVGHDAFDAARDLPPWLKRRLAKPSGAPQPDSSRTARTQGEPREVFEERVAEGRFGMRVWVAEPDHRHGRVELAQALGAERATLSLLARADDALAFAAEQALFLDIETTGLSGGAGTVAFLVGLGSFEGGRFVVRQLFLRGPEEERALLAEVSRRIAACQGLVSFFGKSFDRHRLEDKMRVFGLATPFASRPHLDLYWPCRRLAAAALEDTRLATMERALCGVARRDDLPGAFAPAAWFDYLAGRPHRLEDVFRHNLEDVLSLVALYASLAGAGDPAAPAWDSKGESPPGRTVQRIGSEASLELSRCRCMAALRGERGDWEGARHWLQRARDAVQRAGRDVDARAVQLDLTRVVARLEGVDAALPGWRALADGARDAVAAEACLDLARALTARRAPDAPAWIERAQGSASAALSGRALVRVRRELERLQSRCSRNRAGTSAAANE